MNWNLGNWNTNTGFIVKRENARIRLLHKLVEFEVPLDDQIFIYILYLVLEQSCQGWHSSLPLQNLTDLERVQKNALHKNIPKRQLTLTENAEKPIFVKLCVKNETMREVYPLAYM